MFSAIKTSIPHVMQGLSVGIALPRRINDEEAYRAGRHHLSGRRAFSHENRRIDDSGGQAGVAEQGAAATAGEMARAGGYRDALPAALSITSSASRDPNNLRFTARSTAMSWARRAIPSHRMQCVIRPGPSRTCA